MMQDIRIRGVEAEIWYGAIMSMTTLMPARFYMSEPVSEGFWTITSHPAATGWMWMSVIIIRTRAISADNGTMVCSHEWVEGLLDYYHFTGDERGLETAIGIGENVQRLLDGPMYAKVGEANARETGWALRTLTALYVETRDEKWLPKCGRILQDFKVWEEQYGSWIAPYTDNTVVRVGFMISVAIGSIMRYYRVFPDPALKEMMLRAVDDLIENCYVEKWGVFYYKELPSLNRPGNNTLLLEALAIAYELTGDGNYLKPGLRTFQKAIAEPVSGSVGSKKKVQDAVVAGNASSKNFAQSMIPLTAYYHAASECGYL